MLLRAFPDINWLKKQIATNFSNLEGPKDLKLSQSSWPTVVLNVKTKETDRPNIKGPLSLFTNISGRSSIVIENRQVRVDQNTYFLTNQEQSYSLNIQEETETFNIHFGDFFVRDLWSMTIRSKDKIDYDTTNNIACYHNQIYQRDSSSDYIINSLHKANLNKGHNQLFKDELLVDLFFQIQDTTDIIQKRISEFPALKLSTKKEIFYRIALAVDHMYSFYETDISLEELAKMSCLSKFHFLRGFKSLYKCTPYQYLLNIRLEKAQELLVNSEHKINRIAELVGFDHVSSFSRAYFKKHRYYPSEERRLK